MNEKTNIHILFEKRSWLEIANFYLPREIANSLDFKESLIIAYHLLYHKNWDSNIQQYAINLLNEISIAYSNEWNQTWEYDALLGLAYDITYQHDNRYSAYKRAFNQTPNPPPRLLIELARCCICPGTPPISYDEAIELIQKALKDHLYTDGISVLCNIYSLKQDKEKMDYWSKILRNSNQEFESPSIEPKFLVEEYLQEKKSLN